MSRIPFPAIRSWVFKDALPFWAAHGVDRVDGGFYEELEQSGAPTACTFKRVRVICRQTYVFSHAATLGWQHGEELSRLGFEYLVAKAQLPDGAWARTLSRQGAVRDDAVDLYDLAFVLFALAWRHKASGDPEALLLAHATLDFIQQRLSAPDGGYWHTLPAPTVRLQNPHMHLAEACLAAFDACGDQRFLDQANALVDLLHRRFFDGVSLGERFDADWRRSDGQALEPGHHFEWAWLLSQFHAAGGHPLPDVANQLVAYAERVGVDRRSGAVFDAVSADGAPLRRSSRTWPHTERIKAALALFEFSGSDPRAIVASSTQLLFDRYFAPSLPGLWIDQFDADGAPMVEAVPASILYHLFLAFSEVLRLEPQLSALA